MKFRIYNKDYAVYCNEPTLTEWLFQLLMSVVAVIIGIPCLIAGVWILLSFFVDFSLVTIAFAAFFILIGLCFLVIPFFVITKAFRRYLIVDRKAGTLAFEIRMYGKIRIERIVWQLEHIKPEDFRQLKSHKGGEHSLNLYYDSRLHHTIPQSKKKGKRVGDETKAIFWTTYDFSEITNLFFKFLNGKLTEPKTWRY